MRILVLTIVLCGFVTSSAAQLPEEFTTGAGEYTGYYWRALSRAEKLAHVAAFVAGYFYAAPSNKAARDESQKSCLSPITNPTDQEKVKCLMKSVDAKSEQYKQWELADPVPGGSFGETVEATDRFYEEPEYRMMPITAAWMFSKYKREGHKQADLDEMMDRFREQYLRAPRRLCEAGFGITPARCKVLGTPLKGQ